MAKYLLHDFMIYDHVKSALKEDLGFGDISTDFIYDEQDLECCLNSREDGILCGLDPFRLVFEILDKNIKIDFKMSDGDRIKKGDTIAILRGKARNILSGERVSLNYIQRMSGISTLTNKFQEAIKPYGAKIADTRKTTPNFRIFEKYAVKTGGGGLHRFNLSDCVMLKDNHIKVAGGIEKAVKKIRENVSHAHKIEIECDTLKQVKEALEADVEIIMLDNMDLKDMNSAIELIDGRAIVEASGCVTLENVNEIAKTGVDIISSSAIVAKANPLDLGFDAV